jgi:hypothetical protein
MLLNEFLKDHRKNEEQEATIVDQKKIAELTAGPRKVSAQIKVRQVATDGSEESIKIAASETVVKSCRQSP